MVGHPVKKTMTPASQESIGKAGRVALRRWELVMVWGSVVESLAWGSWRFGWRVLGYLMLWVIVANSSPVWLGLGVLPPALIAMTVLGGPLASRRPKYTFVMDKHATVLVTVALTVGAAVLTVGISVLYQTGGLNVLVDASPGKAVASLFAFAFVIWSVANAGWGTLAGVSWMAFPRRWGWAREWMARVTVSSAAFAPVLFVTCGLLFLAAATSA